ncbi:hypothetical protein [Brevibacillus porteri]|uniref:hypothetical protein n=1 Tax=Brevibacillus porteri TaxID=2126350 RepID=UPI003D1AF27F
MAVIVKRYRVRHDNKTYYPGDVITGLSKAEEAHLISESKGSIEKHASTKAQASTQANDTSEETQIDPEELNASLSADELIKPAGK